MNSSSTTNPDKLQALLFDVTIEANALAGGAALLNKEADKLKNEIALNKVHWVRFEALEDDKQLATLDALRALLVRKVELKKEWLKLVARISPLLESQAESAILLFRTNPQPAPDLKEIADLFRQMLRFDLIKKVRTACPTAKF
ncbi:MAG: hypothetical protein HOP33_01835 [Verrucomicrobia bacterium]|nr:hypothetical protein [Verrucomicrobiota bacterium]